MVGALVAPSVPSWNLVWCPVRYLSAACQNSCPDPGWSLGVPFEKVVRRVAIRAHPSGSGLSGWWRRILFQGRAVAIRGLHLSVGAVVWRRTPQLQQGRTPGEERPDEWNRTCQKTGKAHQPTNPLFFVGKESQPIFYQLGFPSSFPLWFF